MNDNSKRTIVDPLFEETMLAMLNGVAKFDDPIAGLAVMYAGLDADYAKSIGVH